MNKGEILKNILETSDAVCVAGSEIWKAERKKGISGTAMVSLLGLNPYCTPENAFTDVLENSLMRIGQERERFVVAKFARRNGRYKIFNYNTLFRSRQSPRMIGTPDRILFDKETGAYGVLEIKTTQRWTAQKKEMALHQAYYYMLLVGASFSVVSVEQYELIENEVKPSRYFQYDGLEYNEELNNRILNILEQASEPHRKTYR